MTPTAATRDASSDELGLDRLILQPQDHRVRPHLASLAVGRLDGEGQLVLASIAVVALVEQLGAPNLVPDSLRGAACWATP